MSDPLSTPIQWSSQYSVGIAEIDQQHMDLMRHVNVIKDLFSQHRQNNHSIRHALREFIEHVKLHFRFEEELIFLLGDENYSNHKEIHKFLLLQLKRLVEDNQDQISGAKRIIKFLQNWLVGHIVVDDMGYAPLFNQISDQEYQLFLERMRNSSNPYEWDHN
ncbi:MAG: bacteriohemerythrin [Magnetococcales bacterium]|nr:bacteriohemerythrin [Magnetococcales bacterium]